MALRTVRLPATYVNAVSDMRLPFAGVHIILETTAAPAFFSAAL
jgi:hypothetical protein